MKEPIFQRKARFSQFSFIFQFLAIRGKVVRKEKRAENCEKSVIKWNVKDLGGLFYLKKTRKKQIKTREKNTFR